MASVGEIVTKKYGPLPLWAYAVMGGGVGYIFLRSRKKAATATGGAAHTGATPTGTAAGSYGYSGGQLAGSTYPPLDSFMSTLGVQLTRIQDTLTKLTPVPTTPPSATPPPVPPAPTPPPAPVQGSVPGMVDNLIGKLWGRPEPGWAAGGYLSQFYRVGPGESWNEVARKFGFANPQALLTLSPYNLQLAGLTPETMAAGGVPAYTAPGADIYVGSGVGIGR